MKQFQAILPTGVSTRTTIWIQRTVSVSNGRKLLMEISAPPHRSRDPANRPIRPGAPPIEDQAREVPHGLREGVPGTPSGIPSAGT